MIRAGGRRVAGSASESGRRTDRLVSRRARHSSFGRRGVPRRARVRRTVVRHGGGSFDRGRARGSRRLSGIAVLRLVR